VITPVEMISEFIRVTICLTGERLTFTILNRNYFQNFSELGLLNELTGTINNSNTIE